MMKWCLVGAGLKDLARPADKLSVSQNVGAYCAYSTRVAAVDCLSALTATGFIWVRYSFVIIPVNYSLAAVCILLVCRQKPDTLQGQLLRWSLRTDTTGPHSQVSDSYFAVHEVTERIIIRSYRYNQQPAAQKAS